MNIDLSTLWVTLPIMGKGMLGIFIVTAVIICVIFLLNKIPTEKNSPEQK